MSLHRLSQTRHFPLEIDRVVLVLVTAIAALAALDPAQASPSVVFTLTSLLEISPFILLSLAIAAGAQASGLDRQIARAFAGRTVAPAIVAGALFGALSPFCSCGVVPIIAGFLGAGVPLAPVMAFWIASPLMDPEMFVLMWPVFGLGFTLAKLASAVLMGLAGGFAAHFLMRRGLLGDILKGPVAGCVSACSATGAATPAPPVWAFWRHDERRRTFTSTAVTTAPFLGKWLALAFFLESLMLAYLPADAIASHLGSGSVFAVPIAVAAGIPAYLNGYAAIPTVSGLLELGMTPGAALGFMLAGGVTSIPAAMAVWPLVRPRVFALYLAAGWLGAVVAGIALDLA